MKLRKRLCVLLSVLALVCLCVSASIPAAFAADINYDILFDDGRFEGSNSFSKHWRKGWQNTGAEHDWSEESHTVDGTGSGIISHPVGECTSSYIAEEIYLIENARYKFSGWIKIENIDVTTLNGNGGAYFALNEKYNFFFGAVEVRGSQDWTYYEDYFTATETGTHLMECKIWGAYGTAWFDDIEIELVNRVDPEYAKHWTENVTYPQDDGGFTLIGVGDTQGVSGVGYADRFLNCFQYVADQREALNLQYVMHLGDIVDAADDARQWNTAVAAHQILQDAGVKYSLSMGNHDYDGMLSKDPTLPRDSSSYNKYFPRTNYDAWLGTENFGGYDDTMDNTWHKFEVGEEKYLIIALEFGPEDAVLTWAKDLADANPDRHVIVTTHSYINAYADLHEDVSPYTMGNGGPAIWQKFIRKCPNIFMVLCGHYVGYGVSTSVVYGDAGNPIVQMKVDPQNILGGGEPMLALYRITNGTDVSVYYYSTHQQKYYAGSNFSVQVAEAGEGGVVERYQKTKEKFFEFTSLDGTLPKITYASSNETVATVDSDGTVNCKNPGTVTISCEVNGAQSAYADKGVITKYSVTLVVKELKIESVSVEIAEGVEFYAGTATKDIKRHLTVTATYSDGSEEVWTQYALSVEGSSSLMEGENTLTVKKAGTEKSFTLIALADPNATPSVDPSEEPSEEPSELPSEAPSAEPSVAESEIPSVEPSEEPSELPSEEPSVEPSVAESEIPSVEPSEEPSELPSEVPSVEPSVAESEIPSVEPSEEPSELPSEAPSTEPTQTPSEIPSAEPTAPSEVPTETPTQTPSAAPTQTPSEEPTQTPTEEPTPEKGGSCGAVTTGNGGGAAGGGLLILFTITAFALLFFTRKRKA